MNTKTEILPPHWCYVSVIADQDGVYHTHDDGRVTQGYEHISWVIFGTKVEAKAKIEAAWEAARAGRLLTLRDVSYYPQNYKPKSRQLIKAGHFTT